MGRLLTPSILSLLLFASLAFSQCILGPTVPGGDARSIIGIPNAPRPLSPEILGSYGEQVSISGNWNGGCQAGGYATGSLCQLEAGASGPGAGCSIISSSENCNTADGGGCNWDYGANMCSALPGLEGQGGPSWPANCLGHAWAGGSETERNRAYCNDVKDESSCDYVYADLGSPLNFIYQFKWAAEFGGGQFETPWEEGSSAMSFRCSDHPGCLDALPILIVPSARACNAYGCTQEIQGDGATYEFVLPPSVSISPQSGYGTDTFEGVASPPQNPTGSPSALNWRFEAGTGGNFQELLSGSVQSPQAGRPYSFHVTCSDYAEQGCVPGATLRFSASLSYADFGGHASEEQFADASIIVPAQSHPAPGLSAISPSPSTARDSPSLEVTIPVTQGFSAESLEWKWVNTQWQVLSQDVSAVSPGQALLQSVSCPIYDACFEGTTLTYYAKIHYSDGEPSPESSTSVGIVAAPPPEASCGNGVLDQGEQCDPALEDTRGLRGAGGGGGGDERSRCDDATQSCSPYSCTCVQTSYVCGNRVCEGAESAYCPQDCPAGSETSSLIYAGFMISILVIALAFMYSKYFGGIPHLDVFLRDEVVQIGWSVLFAALILGANFIESSNAITGNFLNVDAETTMQGLARDYLNSLYAQGTAEIQHLTEGSLQNQLAATNYLFTGKPLIGGEGIARNANRKAYSQSQELATDLLMPMVISIKMQSQLLDFLFLNSTDANGGETPLIAIFLSLALLMRVLAPTRQAGNYLMAACFSLYVFLPALYVLFAGIHAIASSNPFSFPQVSDPHINFNVIASLVPQAVFLPNLAIVIIITSTQGIAHAIRGISEQV